MRIELEKGYADISADVLTAICGYAAESCLWVKSMASVSASASIAGILGMGKYAKGVKVTEHGDSIDVELHIKVKHGMNISAACHSMIEEVRYMVESATGVRVANVNVCVDGISSD